MVVASVVMLIGGGLASKPAAPEETLAAKGLKKLGFLYLLEGDIKLSERLRAVRLAKSQLEEYTNKTKRLESQIKASDATVRRWDAVDRELNARLLTTNDTRARNQLIAQIRLAEGNMHDAARVGLQQIEALTKLTDPRDKYITAMLELSNNMEATQAQYDALAADEGVKAALAQINQTAKPKVKLGPSGNFATELASARRQRELIRSGVIKLEFSGGVPHVSVTLNEKLSQSMVVDSGAAVVTLSADVAEKLGVTPAESDPSVKLVVASGKTIEAKIVKLSSIRVGVFTAEQVECAVLPKDLKDVDCLLGGTFLRNFAYKMDLAAGELHMTQLTSKPDASSPPPALAKPSDVTAKGSLKRPSQQDEIARLHEMAKKAGAKVDSWPNDFPFQTFFRSLRATQTLKPIAAPSSKSSY